MTILVDWQIDEAIRYGKLIIDPYDPERIQPNSIDLTLDDQFAWYQPIRSLLGRSYGEPEWRYEVLDPHDQASIESGLVRFSGRDMILQSHQFALAATAEKISLPDNIVGQFTGKSSLARLGLMVHVTAGYIDAGFSDPPTKITLELVNCGPRPIKLYAGMAIGQLVFTETEHCRVSYAQKKGAKYNGQEAAAVSKYHLNGEK